MMLEENSCFAWREPPSVSDLARVLAAAPRPCHLIVCLNGKDIPQWRRESGETAAVRHLRRRLTVAARCLQFTAANRIADIAADTDLWLLPEAAARRLHDYFPQDVEWQTQAVPQDAPAAVKPWLAVPPPRLPTRVLVFGAGIAGAATADELARLGVEVCVLEAGRAAGAASGNRQGLLYAKISAHDTAQTELLLAAYGYARRLLTARLPEKTAWGGRGILHLDFNAAEARRHTALSEQTWHQHLYRAVSAAEASALAGVPLAHNALYWRQGVWLHPPAWVRALLARPQIRLYEHAPLVALQYNGKEWQADTPRGRFSGSHVVFCTGADSVRTPLIQDFPLRRIRGQTGLAPANPNTPPLKAALSAEGYVSPAWNGQFCFGASFVPNDAGTDFRFAEDADNRALLRGISSAFDGVAAQPPCPPFGHAAVRCDSRDHLPVVGALGDAAAMRTVYAKLAADKNFPVRAECPWLPQAYANTAHGSRGLLTAPLCAAEVAAQICGTPAPLSARLRQALHPNRLIVAELVRGQGKAA